MFTLFLLISCLFAYFVALSSLAPYSYVDDDCIYEDLSRIDTYCICGRDAGVTPVLDSFEEVSDDEEFTFLNAVTKTEAPMTTNNVESLQNR